MSAAMRPSVVVVNHSNTVPEIVTALSGAAAPIFESEFARFYDATHCTQSGARVVVRS